MLEYLSMPCVLSDMADVALVARPIFVYLQWILSAGSTSGSRPVDPNGLPTMLRFHLVFLILVTIALLFDHLVEGVVDVPVFGISAVQLLCASGALAVLNAPTRRASSLARRRACLLGVFVHLSNAALIADVVFSAVCVVGGHEESVVSVDLATKVGLLLFVTSLPFFALDRELATTSSELTFVWKIWTIEAVDFCTILYGAIDYAAAERSAREQDLDAWNRAHGATLKWDDFSTDWSPALQVYVAAFAANAVLFGILASWVLVRALTKPGHEVILQTRGYMYIATYVFFLDAITDLPVWLASLVTRAYVHNMCLTFNVIVNLLALVRGVYICLVACLLLPPGKCGTPPPLNADVDLEASGTQLTLYGAAQANNNGRLTHSESRGLASAPSLRGSNSHDPACAPLAP